MIKNLILSVLALAAFSLGLSSCGGDGEEPQGKGIFTAIANHRVDFAPIVLNSTFAYENEVGNLFKVFEFRYYVSELKLHKKNGGVYQYPMSEATGEGYFLVDESDPESRLIIMRDVPVGEYTSISFKVGIEPNSVDPQAAQGPLAKNLGMYSPTEGYYSLLLEGMSYESPERDQRIALRTGNQAYEVTIGFQGKVAIVEADKETIIEYNANLGELFASPDPIDFSVSPLRVKLSENQEVAKQFAEKGFGFDHLHNNP